MKKRILKIAGITLLVLAALFALAFGGLYLYSRTYSIPPQAASIENDTGLIRAHGRTLYDANGNPIVLKGVNAGQLLLQESQMSPFFAEPLTNADGSYVTDVNGNVQYSAFSEADLRAAIASNPNLNMHHIDGLLAQYWKSFFSTEDFVIIKQELGLNCIRLPFYYLNILNEDLTRKSEEDAFRFLDWFISCAAEQELYVILDLHGVPGSQNGQEDSGVSDQSCTFWDNQAYVDAVVDLWDFVSDHYTDNAPELGKWIASYGILNEPTNDRSIATPKQRWEILDRMYEVIRFNGDEHVITICSSGGFNGLPNPQKYTWKNVQYEYHWYNEKDSYSLFTMLQDMQNIFRDYDVPVLIGEFSTFGDHDAFNTLMHLFADRNYSWMVWNYKTIVTGDQVSCQAVYTYQMQLQPGELKCNIATCTFDEYLDLCKKLTTENCVAGKLYDMLLALRS